jgi:hypothetical protein
MVESIEMPIINNCCLIPKSLMTQAGVIRISVYNNYLQTLNAAEIEIIQCYCNTANVRQNDDCFDYPKGNWLLGIEDAPNDGKQYVRRNGRWEEFIAGDWHQEDEEHPHFVQNKPSINDVILTGNRVLPEVALTNFEIENLLYNQV